MGEPETIDELMEWRDGVDESLARHRALVLRATRAGEDAGPRFVGMTEPDVRVHFEALRAELNRFVVLGLVAMGEAAVQMDYRRRVGRPGRKMLDTLSRAYRAFHRELSTRQKQRPPFDEGGILAELKGSGVVDDQVVGRFRECLVARHWIAHGRYWERPKAVDTIPPEVVYTRVNELIQALPH